eukprot:5938035-Pleurochrysis_carterae.AAC.1
MGLPICHPPYVGFLGPAFAVLGTFCRASSGLYAVFIATACSRSCFVGVRLSRGRYLAGGWSTAEADSLARLCACVLC